MVQEKQAAACHLGGGQSVQNQSQGIVDDIAERSSRMDELASTAVKTELRDVHLKVGSLIHENASLKQGVFRMRSDISRDFQIMAREMLGARDLPFY
jgi:hypothetical protein